jgi:flagellar hook assembly protein FlgD
MDEILEPTIVEHMVSRPMRFTLNNNYPNPFNSSTKIEYSLSRSAHVVLQIHDSAGRKIITLLNRDQPAGKHQIDWHGSDTAGMPLSSGLYFYRLIVGNHHQSKKMLLLR